MTLVVQKLLLWNPMLFKTILPSIHWFENGGHNTVRGWGTRKRTRKWCHDYLFLMSVLLVSILTSHGNLKGKSRCVTCCEYSKSRTSPCYAQSRARSHIPLIIWDPSDLRCSRPKCRLGHLYTPGAFQKSELACRTMVGPDILAIK